MPCPLRARVRATHRIHPAAYASPSHLGPQMSAPIPFPPTGAINPRIVSWMTAMIIEGAVSSALIRTQSSQLAEIATGACLNLV